MKKSIHTFSSNRLSKIIQGFCIISSLITSPLVLGANFCKVIAPVTGVGGTAAAGGAGVAGVAIGLYSTGGAFAMTSATVGAMGSAALPAAVIAGASFTFIDLAACTNLNVVSNKDILFQNQVPGVFPNNPSICLLEDPKGRHCMKAEFPESGKCLVNGVGASDLLHLTTENVGGTCPTDTSTFLLGIFGSADMTNKQNLLGALEISIKDYKWKVNLINYPNKYSKIATLTLSNIKNHTELNLVPVNKCHQPGYWFPLPQSTGQPSTMQCGTLLCSNMGSKQINVKYTVNGKNDTCPYQFDAMGCITCAVKNVNHLGYDSF